MVISSFGKKVGNIRDPCSATLLALLVLTPCLVIMKSNQEKAPPISFFREDISKSAGTTT